MAEQHSFGNTKKEIGKEYFFMAAAVLIFIITIPFNDHLGFFQTFLNALLSAALAGFFTAVAYS